MVMISCAGPGDLPEIMQLLERSGLPLDGLESSTPLIIVAKDGETVMGCAALEAYGTAGLLRSLAVDPTHRWQTVGAQLVEWMLADAQQHGFREVYLLTETAAAYFPRFGFRPITREAVSPAIHASVEWASACALTAQAMVLELETK
jgi:amino-acid N-acetyltransferase